MILMLWLPIKRCLVGYIHLRVMAILKALIMEILEETDGRTLSPLPRWPCIRFR